MAIHYQANNCRGFNAARLFPPIVSMLVALAFVVSIATASASEKKGALELWRIDCGTMKIDDISYFSDSFHYDGQSATISNGCYLIRNGDRLLLWEAGIAKQYLGNTEPRGGWTSAIETTIVDQLKILGYQPENIDFLALSHFHGDHIGQAADFSKSTLLVQKNGVQWINNNPSSNAKRRLADWFDGDSKLQEFTGDLDVFGDKSVLILATPGHAPGHSSLLVNLPEFGSVLLTGDLFHFRKEIGTRIVSRWNNSRADTLSSMERVEQILRNLEPTIIVQHDPGDIDLLPLFPKSAR